MTAAARKCLVWDLDNTLWDGICLEGEVRLRPEATAIIRTLDQRGILHSIASRGDEHVARRQLTEFGLDQWFLAPRINWLAKPTNLAAIAAELGIGIDSLAFIDDDPFEREHMSYMRPEVLVLDAADLAGILDLPAFNPKVVTAESARRRNFYQEDAARQAVESEYGDRQAFLAGCRMALTLRRPTPTDIPRIRELMSRTHQLNTTGLQLDEATIGELLSDGDTSETPRRSLIVADLSDRFGAYGTVGIAVVETDRHRWRLDYLAMSCRVLGRGVESAFLRTLIERARCHGYTRIEAALRDTGRNGSMRLLYQMSGLVAENQAHGQGTVVFTAGPAAIRRPPAWVEVACESC